MSITKIDHALDPKLELRMVLALRLRDCRLARNVTQQQLGDAAGLTRTTINILEHARMTLSLDNLALLAKALDVRPDELCSTQ